MAGVILVEGPSDQNALEALARRRGRDLAAEGVTVLSMGGATNIGHYLARYRDTARLAGLCDVAEEGFFRRGLERNGFGAALTRAGMEALGFYVCVADLEDELIRSLGVPAVERLLAAQGELPSFRTMQRQPAHRGGPAQAQLRRFMGTRSGRKNAYGRLLVEALDLNHVPHPLDAVLAHL
jgi:hypothetical protein